MSKFERLSRMQFIAGGSLVLAGCAGLGGSPAVRNLASTSQKRGTSAAQKTARGLVRLGSSPTGDSFAVRTASDNTLIGSVALRKNSMRLTFGKNQYVFALRRPTLGFHHVKNGSKFKFVKLKSGGPALLTLDKHNNAGLYYRLKRHYLVVADAKGRLATNELTAFVDDPGTWHGDDDFQDIAPVGNSSSARSILTDNTYYGDTGDSGDQQGLDNTQIASLIDEYTADEMAAAVADDISSVLDDATLIAFATGHMTFPDPSTSCGDYENFWADDQAAADQALLNLEVDETTGENSMVVAADALALGIAQTQATASLGQFERNCNYT